MFFSFFLFILFVFYPAPGSSMYMRLELLFILLALQFSAV